MLAIKEYMFWDHVIVVYIRKGQQGCTGLEREVKTTNKIGPERKKQFNTLDYKFFNFSS